MKYRLNIVTERSEFNSYSTVKGLALAEVFSFWIYLMKISHGGTVTSIEANSPVFWDLCSFSFRPSKL